MYCGYQIGVGGVGGFNYIDGLVCGWVVGLDVFVCKVLLYGGFGKRYKKMGD